MDVVKRILFVTVGTTAVREELGVTRYDQAALQRQLGAFGEEVKNRPASWLTSPPRGNLFGKVLGAHEEIWSRTPEIDEVLELRNSTSAEMTSTWLLFGQEEFSGRGGPFKPGQDRIVLLSSDSAVGFFCTYVNAALMHRRLLDPVCRCGTDFGSFPESPGCPAIRVEVVEGMEAQQGLGQILSKVKEICERHGAGFDRVLFNITGGYKGAVPAITWLASNVFRERASMYYQYEDMRAVMQIQFMEEPTHVPDEASVTLRTAESVW